MMFSDKIGLIQYYITFDKIKDYYNYMFKYYTSSEYRNVYTALEKINLLSARSDDTKYKQLCVPFVTIQNINQFFNTALQIMTRQKITTDKSLKFICFIHVAFQNLKEIQNEQQLNKFLSYLLKTSENVINKESTKVLASYTTDNILTSNKTPTALQTMRNTLRNNPDKISKELYFNCNVIKPYLTYLFKLIAIQDFYQQCKNNKRDVDFNEGWMLINQLKLIEAVIKNFQHVGRYYTKQYEKITVLMTECFNKDIAKLYPKIKLLLSNAVRNIQIRFSTLSQEHGQLYVYEHLDIQNLDDTVKMLDQMSGINENLFNLYMNKYFFNKIEHIPVPNWVQTTDKQFDFVFHLYKIKTKVDTQKMRRGLAKSQSLFKDLKIDKSNMNKLNLSTTFFKKADIPQFSFKKQLGRTYLVS